jgi:hypothetical protein
MVPVEFVSFEDCFNIPVGSEDEVIDRIDWSHRPDSPEEFVDFEEYEEDASTGSESLIEAVHVARRFFV